MKQTGASFLIFYFIKNVIVGVILAMIGKFAISSMALKHLSTKIIYVSLNNSIISKKQQ